MSSHLVRRRLGRLALASTVGLLAACASHAPQDAPQSWRMATEYPATAMPGLGVTEFARQVAQATGGSVTVTPSYDAKAGFKSAELPAAVEAGKLEAADAFAGALVTQFPLLGISSLPFVADSLPKARAMLDAARPAYEKLLASHDQKLLYTTPWPASGIWSKQAINGAADLKALRIRTYDATSQSVLARAGAQAYTISFADAMPRIAAGEVNAVLSSGDGGAGRKLWQYLPHFTEINYAMPISIATVSLKAWNALSPAQRQGVTRAAQATEQAQWERVKARLDENYAAMRQNGVTIQTRPAADLLAALQAAAREPVEAWRHKAGPEGQAILEQVSRP